MTEEHAAQSAKPRASPWPIPLVLGLVTAELGIVFGGPWLPVAVFGLLLFGASVAGILRESAYVDSLWVSGLILTALYAIGGGLIVTLTDALLRGQAMLGAALVGAVASTAVYLRQSERL